MTASNGRAWQDFVKARAFVRGLGLKSREDWSDWTKTGERPKDIPTAPWSVYKNAGWRGLGDWLGTGRVANQNQAYMSFEEARAYVRRLELRNGTEWKHWANTNTRPSTIPKNPDHVYRLQGWVDWGDWLGTGRVANQRRVYKPFPDARLFVHGLNLHTSEEWRVWAKSDEKPKDIPANPAAVYKNEGWQSIGDWLGTGRIANRSRRYRPFREARDQVRSLGLHDADEWRAWAKTGDKPADIPANPAHVYRLEGWQGLGDWLGTGRIANRNQLFRPFLQAREYVRSLGLKTLEDWVVWARSDQRPTDIPREPAHVYRDQGWSGVGDWLGTGAVASYNRKFRPFLEARTFVHSLGLRGRIEWRTWTKSGAKPEDIPANPELVYRDLGWQGFGDWIGTGALASGTLQFRPFPDARAFARTLGLRTMEEWSIWARSGDRPEDLPVAPWSAYRESGWQGTADWLGVTNQWNRNAILSFLRSLIPVLPGLEPAELFSIMHQNGLVSAARRENNSHHGIIAEIVGLAALPSPEDDIQEIADELEAGLLTVAVANDTSDAASDTLELTETIVPREADEHDLPSLDTTAILQAVDALKVLCPSADEEAIEFFIAKAIGKLWSKKLTNESSVATQDILDFPAGEYARIVRERYLSQLTAAESLPVPVGYDFHAKDGKSYPPRLMQRLVAHRLKDEKRLGNWSGTGAGKTMAAILASRVVDAQFTVIVALNNTLPGWAHEIRSTFPDSHVIVKPQEGIFAAPDRATYLLLNFEAFQQPDSPEMVQRLVEEHRIYVVVLDEVHAVKQRYAIASKRRQVLGGLLTLAGEGNPNLRVLGMSATPVVNNLTEAVSLLEMINGVRYPELQTRPTIPNTIAVHQKLVTHGVRYKPEYRQVLNEHWIEIPGDDLIDRLRAVGKGDPLALEQILLDAKLEMLVGHAQPGTLIYSHYVTGMVPRIRGALEGAGYRVGEFTGDDNSGLAQFIDRKVDVLIGSSTLGTGVDGLQYVCNRLIIATLPWTGAGYEQLRGRLFRDGSAFESIDVFIPQVVLQNGDDTWSWDIHRQERIRYKKTLADAAVDGEIPEGFLESESVMLSRSLDSLHGWITRLEQGGDLFVIERERLVIPLPEDEKHNAQRRFGDFATMNARINNANSSTTHNRLQDDPSEWYLYHTLYREARKTWTEVPYEVFTNWLMARPHLVVGDFGCGEAQIAASIPNRVYSFDHVAMNENVIACDMAHTGLDEGILDVAIFSLSLMGTNVEDYLKEAHRLLRLDGRLRIAEPTGHWQGEKRNALLRMITSVGFKVIGDIQERAKFLYIDALKA